jgi:hypothetical protein
LLNWLRTLRRDHFECTIICARCPDIYSTADIEARREEETRRLSDVLGEAAPTTKKTGALRRLFGKESRERIAQSGPLTFDNQREILKRLDRLGDWKFYCPKNHEVDANRGQQIPIATVGPSGASKSHYLPGIIWEMDRLRALRKLRVSLSAAPFTSSGLEFLASQVYDRHIVLDSTPPEEVIGPFGYRLDMRIGGQLSRYSLLLFDVGGEALSSVSRIREQAPFVLLSQGIIVLIDPQDISDTKFDSPGRPPTPSERLTAITRTRKSIRDLANALEELWGAPMQDIPVATSFVIAKADSLNWSFDWDAETGKVIEAANTTSLREALEESSARIRGEFAKFGGELVIDEVEERFNPARLRWVAASATSEMPTREGDEASWDNPTPQGTALSVLHLLDLLGKLPSYIDGDSAGRDPDSSIGTDS